MTIRVAMMAVATALFGMLFTSAAISKSLTITERTKFYTIDGDNAPEFALSMSKRGPYSRQHGRRAWATASRDVTYQLIRQKFKKNCRVKNAKVKLKIIYTLPKLPSTRGLSKRQVRKWNQMRNLLSKHERTHGLYYKQFAKKVRRQLRKLRPASSCRKLEANAKRLVERLSAEDKRRNDRFDTRDRKNYRRMERIYRGS